MDNSSGEIMFYLSGLNDTTINKQIYFAFAVIIYVFTIFANFSLIATILMDKTLHEPMNIFLCNLCVNGIYGSSGFYPKILIDLLSDSHVIRYRACLTQMFVVYSYALCEFTNLTVMALDRYVAICKPLEYHSIITAQILWKLILLSWLFPFCEIFLGLVIIIRLPLCSSTIDKLYCTSWGVVKLSCLDTTLNNFYGYSVTFINIVQAIVIIISYLHIIRTCVRSIAEQSKFMETCLPHMVSLINFTFSLVFDVIYARYGSNTSFLALRNILSIEYLVVPPLLNPLMYGLKLKQIRRSLWRFLNKNFKTVK